MKLRQRKVVHSGPFPDSPTFNPWLIAMHSSNWVSPHPESVGFTTNQQRLARHPFDLSRDVGELFLTNTALDGQKAEWAASVPEYFSSYLGPVLALSGSESTNMSESLLLPEPKTLDIALSSVMNIRSSIRRYSGDPMHLEDLATICHTATGITHTSTVTPIDGGPSYELQSRTVPSPGGLYGIDCYCCAVRVSKLSPFVYKYAPYYHTLEKLYPDIKVEEILKSFSRTEAAGLDVDKLAAVIVLVGKPQKLVRKYGPRGVRYLLLEGGMMSMAVDLAATALGYGCLHYQSYLDDEIQKTLAITDRPYYVLHTVLLGWPAETTEKGYK